MTLFPDVCAPYKSTYIDDLRPFCDVDGFRRSHGFGLRTIRHISNRIAIAQRVVPTDDEFFTRLETAQNLDDIAIALANLDNASRCRHVVVEDEDASQCLASDLLFQKFGHEQ